MRIAEESAHEPTIPLFLRQKTIESGHQCRPGGASPRDSPARSASAKHGGRRYELRAPIHPSGTFPRRRWKGVDRIARASTNGLPASPLQSRGRGDSRGDVACPERDPRFVPPARYETWAPSKANAQRRRRNRPISRVLSWTVIRLGATSPQRSSNLPGSSAGHANGSLFGLAPGGVCRAGPLPDSRCALTAPFHPYRPLATPCGLRAHLAMRCIAGTFQWRQRGDEGRRRYLSVALSVGLRRPGVTWHLALWSPDFPRHSCE